MPSRLSVLARAVSNTVTRLPSPRQSGIAPQLRGLRPDRTTGLLHVAPPSDESAPCTIDEPANESARNSDHVTAIWPASPTAIHALSLKSAHSLVYWTSCGALQAAPPSVHEATAMPPAGE